MSTHPPNKYIAADDDDEFDGDDSALPAFAQPELEYDVGTSLPAPGPPNGKGKARDDLLSGKIGSAAPGSGSGGGSGANGMNGGPRASTRSKIGGVSVETRCASIFDL